MRTLTQLPPDAGRRIRRIRRSKEVGVTALARRLCFDRTTLTYYESGRLTVRPTVAALLLAALDERPSPTEWPAVVCKLVEHMTLEELRDLCGFGARQPRSAA